jgi:hypothetical protein
MHRAVLLGRLHGRAVIMRRGDKVDTLRANLPMGVHTRARSSLATCVVGALDFRRWREARPMPIATSSACRGTVRCNYGS